MIALRLALRLVLQDLKHGEVLLIFMAILLSVAATTSVNRLGDRLDQTMSLEAAALLGGDLSVTSGQPLPEQWRKEASSRGLDSTTLIDFSSVLVEKNQLLLVSVRAVDNGYPLRGTLKIAGESPDRTEIASGVPNVGTTWVDRQIIDRLGIQTGDSITVGDLTLKAEKVLASEPHRPVGISGFAPMILINQRDVEKTHVIQPGSRITHQVLFRGDEARIKAYKQWLEPKLSPGQKLSDIQGNRPEVGRLVSQTRTFLELTSALVVAMTGIAVALASLRHAKRHVALSAILRCHGASRPKVLLISFLEISLVGTVASAIGIAAGSLLEQGLVHGTQGLLPETLADPGSASWVVGLITGLLTALVFSQAPLLALGKLSPMRLLRDEPTGTERRSRSMPVLAILSLSGLVGFYTHDLKLTGMIIGASLSAMVLLGLMVWVLLRLLRKMTPRRPLTLRLGLQHLSRRPLHGTIQVVAFSMSLITLMTIFSLKSQLINDWRHELPLNAPNFFTLNLFDESLDRFKATLAQNSLSHSAFYPIVRGRLVRVNHEDIMLRVAQDPRTESSINRELSLTYGDDLPPDNQVIAGQWPAQSKLVSVSMESVLAQRLNIHVGDQLTFDIAGQTLEATVTSLRSLHWNQLTPNFFMFFEKGALDGFPRSWLTSFHLPLERTSILPEMIKAFPGLTLIDLRQVTEHIRGMIHQVSQAFETLFGLSFIASLMVLFASVRATLDERIQEDLLLRTFGASRLRLKLSNAIEFGMIGLFAGLIAALASEIILGLVYREFLDISPRIHGFLWLLGPIGGCVTVSAAGLWGTRSITKVPPMRILREA